MLRYLLYAAPGLAVLVFLAELDMAVPLLDHWVFLEWYARLAEGSAHWWGIFEPHNEIQILALPRAVMTPLAFATGWSIEAEALLDVAVAGATLALVLAIARRSELLLGRRLHTATAALTAVLVFSPVLWWTWIWTVAFVHLAINAAVVTCAWALTPVGTPLTARRLGIAFAACLLASWTRVEGLLSWWICLPSLIEALSRSPGWRPKRVIGAWAGVGAVQAALYITLLSTLEIDPRLDPMPLIFEPWSNLIFTLNLLGAPLAGFLQALLPEVADSRRYAPVGALVLLAYLVLAIHFASPRRARLRAQALAWLTLGLFGLAFAAAIGVGRVQVLKSGMLTYAYVSSYATTTTLLTISVLQLGMLALADARDRATEASRRRIAWLVIAGVAACLAACYVALVPTALAERDRWRGRDACFELAGYLDFRNTCFVKRPPPERFELLAKLGFRARPRKDLAFVETRAGSRGTLERAVPADPGYVSIEGRLGSWDPGSARATILIGRAGRRSFFALGVSERGGPRFVLSVPEYAIPLRATRVRAWVYEPARGRLVRLEGIVELPARWRP